MSREAKAKKLAEGYTQTKRNCEIASITCLGGLWVHNFIRTARWYVHSKDCTAAHLLILPASIVGGMVLADFLSGVAHWALDTWGSTATPVFGLLIRSFREHHVKQTAMCDHDWIETNGDNSLPINPVLLGASMFAVTKETVGYHTFVVTLSMFVAITNQCHKWAHEVRPHPLAKLAMNLGLIINPINHRVHHSGDHDKSYCITTGWLNPFLDKIRFWRHLETIVTALTGAVPRANDLELLKE